MFRARADAKQVTERGHKVDDLSVSLGVSLHRVYEWLKAPFQPSLQQRVRPRTSASHSG